MGADHGQISEIAGYVNCRANGVHNLSLLVLPFLFLSSYPSSVQTIIVFRPLQPSDGSNSSIFGCSNNLVQATHPCGAWALNRMCRDRDRIIRGSDKRGSTIIHTWFYINSALHSGMWENSFADFCWRRDKLIKLCTEALALEHFRFIDKKNESFCRL